MTIQDNGNVGIGTTAPGFKLDVQGGDVSFSNTGGGYIRTWGQTDLAFNGGSDGIFVFRNDAVGGSTVFYNNTNSELLRITNTGNVGIGTTGPEGSLDVAKGAGEAQVNATSGYLPYGTEKADLILERLHSPTKSLNGFPASLIDLRARNTPGDIWSVAQIVGVVDLNVGGGYAGGLAFLTSAGGNVDPAGRRTRGSAPVTRMVIDANGNVGIGTTTPNERLSVVGNICATGNITANSATCGSDIRWKKDLKPLENTLEKISQLKPVYYYWKKDEFPDKHFTDKRQIGLIAQDMQKVFPELVVEDKEGYLSVDYSRFTSVLLKAIQEQQQIIHDQQKIIQELQAENAQIKAENAQTKSEVKALAEKMNILINTLSAEKKVGNK
jgi:hypothetical protein